MREANQVRETISDLHVSLTISYYYLEIQRILERT